MRYFTTSLIILVVLFFFYSSCDFRGSNSNVQIDTHDTCATQPFHTYEVYKAPFDVNCKSLPLIILLDPHGNGEYALEQFKVAANNFPVLLVASNLVKNNYPDYILAIGQLIEDVQEKYGSGTEIYLAGFSGGARMALNFAQYYPVDGLIVSGALSNAEQLRAIQSPIVALIGMDDFNFIEAAQYIFKPESAPANLYVEFVDGLHSWPEASILKDALGFLLLGDENKTCGNDKAVRLKFITTSGSKIDSLIEQKEVIKAVLTARNLSRTDNFNVDTDFRKLTAELESTPEYVKDLDHLKESIRFELTVRHAYYSALQEEDTLWWKNEINSLDAKIKGDRDKYRGLAYQRIKGFLGIMCYSLCNQQIGSGNFSDLDRLLSIYGMIEPWNPDMLYFSALLSYEKEDHEATASYLIAARSAGFADIDRLEKELPHEFMDIFIDEADEHAH